MKIVNNRFELCIQCMTYNQSSFIKEAMDGFAMQQTNFPFVAVIVDDCSTDGEQKVLRTYIDAYFDCAEDAGYRQWETEDASWIIARHKENKNCHFVVALLKRNLYLEPEKKEEVIKEWLDAKYIALCEGDDYWTDPLKLQKQVDFMETHLDFSLCFHGAKIYHQNERRFIQDDIREVPSETDIYELARGNFIHTMTVVYRNNPLVRDDMKKLGRVMPGDYALHMMNAKYGIIKKLPDCMAVYRLNTESVWGTKDVSYQLPIWNEMLIRLMPFFDDRVNDILHDQYMQNCKYMMQFASDQVRSSKPYRLGKFLLAPFSWMKKR